MAKFHGFKIEQNEDGFYWRDGGEGHGYFDTIEECLADIADWNRREAEPREDSPCLDAPWWAFA